jgi:CheY-like chemotaxis protein
VILLDVNMPGMDGFETAEAIHQRPRSSDIPIIFITAFVADELDRLKAYQRGAVDFLFTPVIPQMLYAKISVFVSLATKNEELRRQARQLSQRTTDLIASNQRQPCQGRIPRHAGPRVAQSAVGHQQRRFADRLARRERRQRQPCKEDHPAPEPAPGPYSGRLA